MYEWLLSIFIVLLFGAGVYLEVTKKFFSNNFDQIKLLLQNLRFTFDHWGLNKKYSSAVSIVFRFVTLAKAMSLEEKEPRELRKEVSNLVVKAHDAFFPNDKLNELERDSLVATYVAVIYYPEIRSVISSISGSHSNLEVRKATNIAIDVLGELIDLKDKLGQQYFQHIIYGLNLCLVQIRDNGKNKKSMKKIAGALFRIYKLSRAYSRLRSLERMTEDEFYKQVRKIMDSVVGTMWKREFGIG